LGNNKIVLAPRFIAIIVAVVIVFGFIPIIIITALPQVMVGWGSVNDQELNERKAYADHLVACYENGDIYKVNEIQRMLDDFAKNNGIISSQVDERDLDVLWLIAIDSVKYNQNVSSMTDDVVLTSVRRSIEVEETKDKNGAITSVNIKNKDPEKIMSELGFTDEQKNWARLMYNTMACGQYLSSDSSDYTTENIFDYSGTTFAEGDIKVVYFNQLDERWKNKLYGKSGTIGSEGCGPTALAIVVSTFTEENITPVDVAKWSADNGHRCIGSGSYHSLIPAAAKHYGLSVKGLGTSNADEISKSLSNGSLIIALMKKGHFTKSGHFIVLRGVTSDGKVMVADPASYSRSEQQWDISIILNECLAGAGANGPLWEISR